MSKALELVAEELALEEQARRMRAREGLLNFTCYTKPDYQVNWHHRLMAAALNKVERGEIKRLMINVQPRAGKSELVSRRFPAWYLGRHPDHQIIACSYGTSLAQHMCRDVQRIIDDQSYGELFPDTYLSSSNVRTSRSTDEGSYLRNADEFEIVGHQRSYKGVGAGGPLTGYGASCVVGGTMIETEAGKVPIERFFMLKTWPKVWSYDAKSQEFVLRRVKAVQRKIVTQVVTVAASNGSMVTATPNHLFLTDKGRGVEASLLGPGFACISQACHLRGMPTLWPHGGKKCSTFSDADTQWREAFLLLSPLLGCLQTATVRVADGFHMPGVWSQLSEKAQNFYILRPKVCQCGSCQIDVDKKEPMVAGWNRTAEKLERSQHLQTNTANHTHARQVSLCNLQRDGFSSTENAYPSHRLRPQEQCRQEFNNNLFLVPYPGTQDTHVKCNKVTWHSPCPTPVYDIQVEETENFVANDLTIFNCAIVDDIHKSREEANSPRIRERVWDWYVGTFYNRLEKDAAVVLCMTRWHQDDLAGRLLAQAEKNPEADQWTVLTLPSVVDDEAELDPGDPRKKGEVLWPEKYSVKRLKAMRETMGERDWISLYQQKPAPAEGNVIKKTWWRYWTELPEDIDLVVASADMSLKDNERADFTVITVWLRSGPNFYLVDMIRDRMGWTEQKSAFHRVRHMYPDLNAIYIEDAAAGVQLVAEAKKTVPGVVAVPARGSKLTRLEAVSGLIEAGNVFLPEPSMPSYHWVTDVINEVSVFPNGAHDDIVDSLSMALAKMRSSVRTFDFLPGSVEKDSFIDGLSHV